MKVVYMADYRSSIAVYAETGKTEKIDLPKSNVLSFKTNGGNGVIIRPSGTEPKIKAYITAIADSKEKSQSLADELVAEAKALMGV